MDWLKDLLGEELFNTVSSKLGSVKILKDDGSLIPKGRLDEVIQQKKDLKEQLDKRDQDLVALKDQAKDLPELKKQITEIQEANKNLKSDLEKKEISMKKSLAVKEALLDAGVSDVKAREVLSKEFDIEKIELEEGKVKGFDTLIKPFKESKTFESMFSVTGVGANKFEAGKSQDLGEYQGKNPYAKKTLNIAEQVKLEKDPSKKDLVQKLKQQSGE